MGSVLVRLALFIGCLFFVYLAMLIGLATIGVWSLAMTSLGWVS